MMAQVLPYLLYFGLYIPLFILPTEFLRMIYVYGTSFYFMADNFFSDSRDNNKLVLLGLTVLHGTIHNVTPFFDTTGYVYTSTPAYDLICHSVMMFMAWRLLRKSKQGINQHPWFDLGSKFILTTTIFNTINSFFVTGPGLIDDLFTWGSFFTTLSVGYWVATMIHWRNWGRDFAPHLVGMIVYILINWGLFKYNDFWLGEAMRYKYIESVFIFSMWVPHILDKFCKK